MDAVGDKSGAVKHVQRYICHRGGKVVMSLFRIFLPFAVFGFLLLPFFLSFLSFLSISSVNISSVPPSARRHQRRSPQALRTIVRRYSHFWARFCIIRKKKLKRVKNMYSYSLSLLSNYKHHHCQYGHHQMSFPASCQTCLVDPELFP
jgi:hypothetical protein